MGNRTERGGYPERINPSTSPFLHVVSFTGGEHYEYVASLNGLSLHFGKRVTPAEEGYDYTSLSSLKFDLLSPPQIPPQEIPTLPHVKGKIGEYAETILSTLEQYPEADIIACSHGVYWDFLPEQEIAAVLTDNGYKVLDSFPRVGGRKRIQEHGIILER